MNRVHINDKFDLVWSDNGLNKNLYFGSEWLPGPAIRYKDDNPFAPVNILPRTLVPRWITQEEYDSALSKAKAQGADIKTTGPYITEVKQSYFRDKSIAIKNGHKVTNEIDDFLMWCEANKIKIASLNVTNQFEDGTGYFEWNLDEASVEEYVIQIEDNHPDYTKEEKLELLEEFLIDDYNSLVHNLTFYLGKGLKVVLSNCQLKTPVPSFRSALEKYIK